MGRDEETNCSALSYFTFSKCKGSLSRENTIQYTNGISQVACRLRSYVNGQFYDRLTMTLVTLKCPIAPKSNLQ